MRRMEGDLFERLCFRSPPTSLQTLEPEPSPGLSAQGSAAGESHGDHPPCVEVPQGLACPDTCHPRHQEVWHVSSSFPVDSRSEKWKNQTDEQAWSSQVKQSRCREAHKGWALPSQGLESSSQLRCHGIQVSQVPRLGSRR